MHITLLGTGTPILETNRQGSATLVTIDGEHLLFDTGRGITTQLLKSGLSARDIDAIFVTHFHLDHIGDLGDLVISAWHAGREQPLRVFGPPGLTTIIMALIDQVYQYDTHFFHVFEQYLGHPRVDIRAILDIHEITPGVVTECEQWNVVTDYVEHGVQLGLSRHEWPCVGYRVEHHGHIVTISGDTIVCDALYRLAEGADVLVQCCYLADAELTHPEFNVLSDMVIASSTQVGMFAARAGVATVVLTHIRKKSSQLMQALVADVHQHFPGEVIVGEDLMVIEVS